MLVEVYSTLQLFSLSYKLSVWLCAVYRRGLPSSQRSRWHRLTRNKPGRVAGTTLSTMWHCKCLTLVSYLVHPLLLQKQEKKSNSNMMRCRKCGFKFCYRCKEACFGQWHFSDYGCPLNSKIQEDIDYFKSLTATDSNDTWKRSV